jgi:hypothetical protein
VLRGLAGYKFCDAALFHSSQRGADVRLITAIELLGYLAGGHPFLGVHTRCRRDLSLQRTEIRILDRKPRLRGRTLGFEFLGKLKRSCANRPEEPCERVKAGWIVRARWRLGQPWSTSG